MELSQEELKKVYFDYSSKVMCYIRSRVSSLEDAEDIHSQVFTKVYEKIATYDEKKASISTWIYTITHNKVIDYYKTKKSHSELNEEILAPESVNPMCKSDALQDLADALKQLSKLEQKVIVLNYYSGLKLKEIAEKLQISYSYVKLLHTNAILQLKKLMDS